jgi:Tfp pilus assembly protein PilV
MRSRQTGGFALLDPLVGMLVFAVVMVGAINFWRLAEYKCARARIDARVSQILRESTDYMTYVAYDLLPADGAQLRSGFLLHPVDPGTGNYQSIYPFNVTAAVTTTGGGTPAEAKQIVLTLSYNTAPEPQAADDNPLQTAVHTDVLTRAKE